MITKDSNQSWEYDNDKSILRDDVMKDFVNAIKDKMSIQFGNDINNAKVEFYADGVIDTQDDITVVKLPFSTLPIGQNSETLGDGISNCTGATLNVKDKVRVFYGRHDMKDAYVGVVL